MQKMTASFRMTALLYSIVLLLALSSYYIYTTFQTIQSDSKAMYASGFMRGVVSQMESTVPSTSTVSQMQQTLASLDDWVAGHQTSDFYMGPNTLKETFKSVQSCWQNFSVLDKEKQAACLEETKLFETSITHIVYPEQKQLDNLLYVLLFATLFLVLYLIYFVRLFISLQMKKHAIYDHDTHLFNQKYFLAELHTSVERAKREQSKLSLLAITCDDLSNDHYESKPKKHLAQKIAHILSTLTRESDTVCRYEEHIFVILMSHTNFSEAQHLENRIKRALESHDFQLASKPTFHYHTTEWEKDITENDLLQRAINAN